MPDSLQAVLVFAATADGDSGPDALASRDEAAAWLRSAGWLAEDAGLSNSEHAALLRLRNAVGDTLAAPAGTPEAADAAARLTRSLSEGRLVVTAGPGGTVELATAARASYPSVVAAVAVAIAHAAYSGRWPPDGR
ncbi:MAG TPA: ABATE domain-containing protein [Streptosporangiaceae bacterium]|nr:ABATE domain-containing protein [Streptosporangiaceae bacterium]